MAHAINLPIFYSLVIFILYFVLLRFDVQRCCLDGPATILFDGWCHCCRHSIGLFQVEPSIRCVECGQRWRSLDIFRVRKTNNWIVHIELIWRLGLSFCYCKLCAPDSLDPSPLTRSSFWTYAVGITVLWSSLFSSSQTTIQKLLALPDAKTANQWVELRFRFDEPVSLT